MMVAAAAAVCEQILQLRQEKSELLGFKNYAQLSMASKMATFDRAEDLLEELRSSSYSAAQVRDQQAVQAPTQPAASAGAAAAACIQ